MKKVMLVFGTRPEAIKMCPLVLELKKRKELQKKVATIKDQQQKASEYLYYCDEIAKAEKNIADARQKYLAGVANKEPLAKEIQLLEHEIAQRVDAALSAIKTLYITETTSSLTRISFYNL